MAVAYIRQLIRSKPLTMFHYRICGLSVAAELPLPGAIPLDDAPSKADVRLGVRATPRRLESPIGHGPGWEVDATRFLLTLPDSGRFLASGGETIDLDPAAAVDDMMPFVLGTGFGALLYQRGGMVLHGATVEWNGGCVAVCGFSGTGKSTLAAALCRLGCRLVSDDLAALTAGDCGAGPLVQPDGRRLKLYDTVIKRLGMAAECGPAVRPGLSKHYVSPPAALSASAPLNAVYVLRDVARGNALSIDPLAPLAAAQALLNQSYRRRLALMAARHDSRSAALRSAVLRHVPVFRLSRPRDLDRLEETATAVLTHWSGLKEKGRA